jgi:hypothetical protein
MKTAEVFVNTILVAACLAVLAVCYPLVKRTYFPNKPPVYKMSEKVDLPKGALAEGKPTLVLGIRPGCEWCEKDMPIYQSLTTSSRRIADGSIQVAVVTAAVADDTENKQLKAWMQEKKLPGKLTVTPKLPFAGTPTVLLVDAQHRIKASWLGALSPVSKGREDLFKALDGL